ncbi:CHASE2 domain-containing protein [Gloeocapsa sp. PCC 73106]|uniref:CHASE2 domain-containing protein n=1 Tax=Gloeocapsa sp. PCC 73106 TaxID=102232 RepID=UPI0002ABF5B4|nr:CHASE2 domain-containing protein [Gloeocapsa sp. PCC 73106]ELR99799.1 putative transmembrane sensor domain protein [Gloeocapsa sp. PCC 73106]
MNQYPNFQLKVNQIGPACSFELLWGKGQQVSANLVYPDTLTAAYQSWAKAYRDYYQQGVRGRVVNQGGAKLDPHSQLAETQSNLLREMTNWLDSRELSPLRVTMAQVIKKWLKSNSLTQVDLFLTCSSLELERLPWEAWDLESQLAAAVKLRMIRSPNNIRGSQGKPRSDYRRGRARILAIFGDDTGLDFARDVQALSTLKTLAEVKVITKGKQSIHELRANIFQAIADAQGWDMLFFAGHSQETQNSGGELAIAPGVAITLEELRPSLEIAQASGLQFALFNSCSGLSIAKTLIDLGLNQVVIMREPIPNSVAQLFVVRFLEVLVEQQDVVEAVEASRLFLKQQYQIKYPSGYLIPSLFGHPGAGFYRLEPSGWRAGCQRLLPTAKQAIALGALGLFSLLPSVQDLCLNGRTLTQAVYRDLTEQVTENTNPQVLLVLIDEESFEKAEITQRSPLDRSYLAKILNRLLVLDARVIGFDYLLDRPQGVNDRILARSIDEAVKERGNLLVFGSIMERGVELGVHPNISDLNFIAQGSVESFSLFQVPLPQDCLKVCPFTYLLALNQKIFAANSVPVRANSSGPYKTLIVKNFEDLGGHGLLIDFLKIVRLNPVIDYSIPPKTVYKPIAAHKLLEEDKSFNGEVVLVVSGGYAEAGINGAADYFSAPWGFQFWQSKIFESRNQINGGEINAYIVHHWLTQQWIIPFPGLLAILIAGGLGRAIALQQESSGNSKKGLVFKCGVLNILYLLLSLQAYVSLRILFPWLFPSLAFWFVFLTSLRKKSYEK